MREQMACVFMPPVDSTRSRITVYCALYCSNSSLINFSCFLYKTNNNKYQIEHRLRLYKLLSHDLKCKCLKIYYDLVNIDNFAMTLFDTYIVEMFMLQVIY